MNGKIDGLRAAVPYLRLFKGTTFVIKLGGAVLADPHALQCFADQVALLHQVGIQQVIVHGGGPQATELAERLGIPVQRIDGRRVTCEATLEVAKMVFAGKLSTDLLAALSKSQVNGVGISGVDAGLILARRRPPLTVKDPANGSTQVDLGLVGEIEEVRPDLIRHLLAGGYVPVVSALAGGDDGQVYNVNADTIAARLAAALQSEKLLLLTSVAGVLADASDPSSLVSHMDGERLEEMLAEAATGGMKAKLEACRQALDGGVRRAHIINGLNGDSLLTEVFTNEGCGTLIEPTITLLNGESA
jgi:acetylglutamate kinase